VRPIRIVRIWGRDPANAAALPAGREVRLHRKVSLSPLGSVLAAPSSVTLAPIATCCAAPASATGARFALLAVTVTVAGALSTVPSLTTSVTSNSPMASAPKLGWACVASTSVALLPVGLALMVHR
jgi:hypothetical protein